MKSLGVFAIIILFLLVTTSQSYARSGCCSHHGGVLGCGCSDGTPLSSTCLPYYPECSVGGGTQQDSSQSVPQTQTYTTAPVVIASSPTIILQVTNTPMPTFTLIPTTTLRPTNTPTPLPSPQPQTNFFSWLFGLFFGQKQTTRGTKSYPKKTVVSPSLSFSSAGIENAASTCKAIRVNSSDTQAYLPDANCTPGTTNTAVTQANIDSTICVSGYTKTIRPSVSYTGKLKIEQVQEYGYTDTKLSDYEEDHFISLELGGNPSDPKNLWPEPHPSTNEKDKVENYLHKEVCNGSITLAQAQSEISKNWYDVYQQIK